MTENIIVSIYLNTEPPVFTEELRTVYVRINDNFTFTLPEITDADGDSYSVSNLYMPGFGRFSGDTFTFKPKGSDANTPVQFILITVRDDNSESLTSTYILQVFVVPL